MNLFKSYTFFYRYFQKCGFILSGAFAFSVHSAVNFEDIAISLENSTVPLSYTNTVKEWEEIGIAKPIAQLFLIPVPHFSTEDGKGNPKFVLFFSYLSFSILHFFFFTKRKPVLKEKLRECF